MLCIIYCTGMYVGQCQFILAKIIHFPYYSYKYAINSLYEGNSTVRRQFDTFKKTRSNILEKFPLNRNRNVDSMCTRYVIFLHNFRSRSCFAGAEFRNKQTNKFTYFISQHFPCNCIAKEKDIHISHILILCTVSCINNVYKFFW